MKIKEMKLGYGEIVHQEITIPGDDVEELNLYVAYKHIGYKDEIYFTEENGRQKTKVFYKEKLCGKGTIKFQRNKIEKSLMDKIIKTEDIGVLKLVLEDGSEECYKLPYIVRKSENTLKPTHNSCQSISFTDDFIELIFKNPRISDKSYYE